MGTTIKNLFINEDDIFRSMESNILQGDESSFKGLIREKAAEACIFLIDDISRGMTLDAYDDINNADELGKIVSELSYENKHLLFDKLVSICREGKIEDISFENRDESSHLRKFSVSFESDFLEIAKIVKKIDSKKDDSIFPSIDIITINADGITSFQSETVNDMIVKWKNEIDIPANDDKIIKCVVAGIPMFFDTFGSLMSTLTGLA